MHPASPGSYKNAAGQIIYADGVVQNWVRGNGALNATFIGVDGNRIELPGVNVTVDNTMKSRGSTLAASGFGHIHLDPTNLGLEDIEHEYGHYLDYLSRGQAYYDLVVVPLSSFNALTAGSHQYYWTEIRADQMAIKFFGPNSAIAISKFYPH